MAVRLKPVLLLLGILIAFNGCVEQKHSNEGCGTQRDQGLEISFYSRSRCQNAATWPEDIHNLMVLVFDGEGILAHHRLLTDIELDAGYSIKVPTDPGLYTVIGWSGMDNGHFDIISPVDGTTQKTDLVASILRTGDEANSILGITVYTGESNAVYVEAATPEDEYKPVAVNLLEITNRLTISVEGLPTNAEDYEITVEADNGSINYDGTIADDDILTYRSALTYGEGIVEGDFTLLKLETGFNYFISVRNIVSGTQLYHGSLLGALILKNPEVDLSCDHDFTIRFTARDQCDCGTYAITEIWVNNWLVHSYDTDL